MTFEFLPPAVIELEEAISYYDAQQPGLGDQFLEESYRAIQRILLHPRAWSKFSRRTRRCRTNRFPYGIIYQLKNDRVIIIAVMHLHRHPIYWKDRLK